LIQYELQLQTLNEKVGGRPKVPDHSPVMKQVWQMVLNKQMNSTLLEIIIIIKLQTAVVGHLG
jgi:hypothetical protein